MAKVALCLLPWLFHSKSKKIMKRGSLPFDDRYFEKKKKAGKSLSTEQTFREIYESNHWSGKESVSGSGSAEMQTNEIGMQIPRLVRELGIRKFLDVPCGDFNWMSKIELELDYYIGGDIISEIVYKNSNTYGTEKRKFIEIDLTMDELPKADMLLCRDCLVHFSNDDMTRALKNIKQSKITYLLTTTFPACPANEDIVTGDWRVINLELAPFSFPKALKLINEKCSEGENTYADKSLGLWKISDL